VPCDGPRMNPSVDVGCPPRPFRHLRMAERRTPDLSSSRAPVHSALVQKSVTAITNPAGRLSIWMLGKSLALGKWKTANSWQVVCNESNEGGGFRRSAFGFRLPAVGFRASGFSRVKARIALRAMDGQECPSPHRYSSSRKVIVVYSGRKTGAPMSVGSTKPSAGG
jgi:hypothetical protein